MTIYKNENKITLDLGSAFVSAAYNGVLVRERALAVAKRNPTVLVAYGREAEILSNRLEKDTFLVRPFKEGAVQDAEVAALVIAQIVKKLTGTERFARIPTVVVVSAELSAPERDGVKEAARRAGLKNVTLADNMHFFAEIASAAGTHDAPSVGIVMGAGLVEIALFFGGQTRAACSVNLAGNTVDLRIADIIAERFNLRITREAAERFKKLTASLYARDGAAAEVIGVDILDGTVKACRVTAADAREAVCDCFEKLVELTKSFLVDEREAVQSVPSKIYLAGGLARMTGLADFFAERLGLPVETLGSPEIAIVKRAASL